MICGPDMLIDYELKVVDQINTRLMARGGKKMAHFLVYNEPNLIPLIYHYSDLFPIERQGADYLLPAYDTMLSHYIKAYDGIYDLFERKGWGTPHVGFTIANLCAYEFDKQLDDLVRLRSWGVARADAAAKIAECRAAWRSRLDEVAKSQLTDEQYVRYVEMITMTADKLRPELFVKTLDALYASPRERSLTICLSMSTNPLALHVPIPMSQHIRPSGMSLRWMARFIGRLSWRRTTSTSIFRCIWVRIQRPIFNPLGNRPNRGLMVGRVSVT